LPFLAPLSAERVTALLRDGALAEIVHALIVGDISRHAHPVVVLQFFELVVRYGRFFEHHPEFVGAVVGAFVDARGIQHPRSALVRSRCCYLLHRFLRALPDAAKRHLAAFAEPVIGGLQGMVFGALEARGGSASGCVSPSSSSASSSSLSSSASSSSASSTISLEDAQLLSEVLGTLVTQAIVGEARSLELVGALMAAYRQRLDAVMSAASSASASASTGGAEVAGRRVAALIEVRVQPIQR
jgi:hypothetical protein